MIVEMLSLTCIFVRNNDLLTTFRSPHHLEKFNEYLNTKHANIKFTSEKEVN